MFFFNFRTIFSFIKLSLTFIVRSMSIPFTQTILILLFASLGYAQENEPVKIFHKPSGDGGFVYYAENVDWAPYQLEMNFPQLNNLKSSVTLPYYTVVYPGDPVTLFQLHPEGSGNTSFRSSYKMTLGDPNAEINSSYTYLLPYQQNESFILSQGADGSYTHQGKIAWDFLMDEGTPVCASRSGVVVKVKQDSNQGGPDQSFRDHANRITILHEDGSFADYAHLRLNGALVSTGDNVQAGQVIGYSGNTGWSTRPHLHFQVYKAVKFGIQTVPVTFITGDGEVTQLKEQTSYRSVHR